LTGASGPRRAPTSRARPPRPASAAPQGRASRPAPPPCSPS
jgi:hypothetical protein